MLLAPHRAFALCVLLSSTGGLVAGCRGESWVDVPRAAPAAGSAQSEVRLSASTHDAGLAAEADDEDGGSGAGECWPHTSEVLEFVDYADDFPVPGPDVAMTWQPEVAGIYVATLTSTGATRAELQLLLGSCKGSPLSPIQGLEGAWDGFAFEASPDQQYTFVIEGGLETETVQLSIELGCEQADDMHCVRADSDGKPECGVRYAATEGSDHMRCEAMRAPGEVDARCPDTTFRGSQVEGCCKPNGVCGHLDEQLGCHDLAQANWPWSPPLEFYCDERAVPDPPEYFECSEGACETAMDCCAHPTYGNAACVDGWCVLPEE